jgi:hypothetical protein
MEESALALFREFMRLEVESGRLREDRAAFFGR